MRLPIILIFASLALTGTAQRPIQLKFAPCPITRSFLGNGVQWSAYPHADSPTAEWGELMTAAKWKTVFERLDFMRPRMVRVMDQAHWRYYKGLDEQGEPVTDFDTPEVRSLCMLLDYCQRNGIAVMIGEWGTPDNGIRPEGILRADDPRWSRMIGRFLEYLLDTKGYTCIRYYNLVNEPNGDWASTDGNWDEWSRGYRMMHDELVRRGLDGRIGLAGPDVVANFNHKKSPVQGRDWVRLTAEKMPDITALYDVHPYPDQNTIRSGTFYRYYSDILNLTASRPKPFVFGELGLKYKGEMGAEQRRRAAADTVASDNDSQMFVYEYFYGVDMTDALLQAMMAGFSGAIAWDLDDAMHTEGDTGDRGKLKRWGMWNSLGTEFGNPGDERLRPWFYPWSLMCRCFTPGMEIYAMERPFERGLRAVKGTDGQNCSVALLNSGEETLTVHLPEEELREFLPLYRYVYSETFAPKNRKGFPKAAGREKKTVQGHVSVEIPGRSFVLLTTIR